MTSHGVARARAVSTRVGARDGASTRASERRAQRIRRLEQRVPASVVARSAGSSARVHSPGFQGGARLGAEERQQGWVGADAGDDGDGRGRASGVAQGVRSCGVRQRGHGDSHEGRARGRRLRVLVRHRGRFLVRGGQPVELGEPHPGRDCPRGHLHLLVRRGVDPRGDPRGSWRRGRAHARREPPAEPVDRPTQHGQNLRMESHRAEFRGGGVRARRVRVVTLASDERGVRRHRRARAPSRAKRGLLPRRRGERGFASGSVHVPAQSDAGKAWLFVQPRVHPAGHDRGRTDARLSSPTQQIRHVAQLQQRHHPPPRRARSLLAAVRVTRGRAREVAHPLRHAHRGGHRRKQRPAHRNLPRPSAPRPGRRGEPAPFPEDSVRPQVRGHVSHGSAPGDGRARRQRPEIRLQS